MLIKSQTLITKYRIMKIKKYIIKEERKGFKTQFNVVDEFEHPVFTILFKPFSGKMSPFEIGGSIYEVKKRSMFSYRHDIYKDGEVICNVGLKNGFSAKWLIQYPEVTIVMSSNLSFKNIDFYIDNNEIGKASRQIKGFKSAFGLAVNEDIDSAVLVISLVNRLMQLRASMAA